MGQSNSQNTQRSQDSTSFERSFGFRDIEPALKQKEVNRVFSSVAHKYDLMNDILSAGMHRLWKSQFITMLNPPAKAGWQLLDVAGGTGDIAFGALKRSRNQIGVTILDINEEMLFVGKKRAAKLRAKLETPANISFICANAEKLPFKNDQFDAYCIAFGIRNVANIDKALLEAYRVLKPGGRFLCLEFSEVEMPILDKIYDFWSFSCMPKLGKYLAKDEAAYRYLVESIRKFPNQEDFAALIKKHGFGHVSYKNLTGGIASIHKGWKI